MSEGNRFKVPPGTDFDDTPTVEIIEREYISEADQGKNHLLETLESRKVDYSQKVEKPPTAISINGKPMAIMGEFSFIYGKAKSKKTFATTMAIAAAIKGKWSIFEGHLPEGKKKVLFFDTEQSHYYVNRLGKNITRLINHQGLHDNLTIYRLRGIGHQEKRELISFALETTPGVGLVVIDGVRDMVQDINSQEEAIDIATYLLKLTDTYGIHITTVLHENKDKNNKSPRGAIGTELINKCGTAINIELDKSSGVSKVEATDTRDVPFEPFGFILNDKVLPEIVEGWKPKTDTPGRPKAPNPDELTPFETFELLARLKKDVGDKHLRYAELCDALSVAYRAKMKKDLAVSRSKTFVNYYKLTGNLKVNGKEGTKHAWYEVLLPESPSKQKDADQQTYLDINGNLHDQKSF